MMSIQPKYLLRWRFDYSDNKPPKWGAWNRHGETQGLQAWCTTKENLSYAYIEAKDIVTREIKVLAVCKGYDFINFQWVAGVTANPFSLAKGEKKIESKIIGMTIEARYEKITVLINGQSQVVKSDTSNQTWEAWK